MGNTISHCEDTSIKAGEPFSGSVPSQDATAMAEKVGVPPALALDATDAPAAVIGPHSDVEEASSNTIDDDFVHFAPAENTPSANPTEVLEGTEIVNADSTEGAEAGEEGNGEEEDEKLAITIRTTPIDPRFPGSNQARHCYTAYNEYHKCVVEKGEDSMECASYARAYRSICPAEWVQQWNELREEGKWFGKY